MGLNINTNYLIPIELNDLILDELVSINGDDMGLLNLFGETEENNHCNNLIVLLEKGLIPHPLFVYYV